MAQVRIVTIEQPPFVFVDERGYLQGFLMDVLQGLNLSASIYMVPDGSYGTPAPGGRWNGMIGELLANRADVALAPMIISPIRRSVIDFSAPFMVENLALVVKKDRSINGVNTLLDSDYEFGTVQGSFANAYFLNYRGKSRLMQEIAAKMQSAGPSAHHPSMPAAMEGLEGGEFVLGTTSTAAKLLSKQKDCGVLVYPLKDYSAPLAIGIRKQSGLKGRVNNALLKMIVKKQLGILTRKWFGHCQ